VAKGLTFIDSAEREGLQSRNSEFVNMKTSEFGTFCQQTN